MNLRITFLIIISIGAFIIASCKDATESVIPDIGIPETISSPEGTASLIKVLIPVSLSQATDQQVSCTWSTSDGTAKAGEDYTSASNMVLVFAPGETTKNIEILVSNDSTYESDENFYVSISNIKNATLTGYRTVVTISNDDAFNPMIRLVSLTKMAEGTAIPVKARVSVSLTPASEKEVVVKWSTLEGSAKNSDDFIAVSGALLVFAPGETQKNIEVQLVNDDILEFNDSFFIVVDQVTNATYTPKETKVTITNDDSYTPELASDGYITPDSYPGMTNVWSDEFDGTALNLDWWTHELGAGGWGNNELQSYTNLEANSFVSEGKLKIVAINNYGNYTSARLVTKGKKEFTYGRIDIRAKMPYGQGIWPALWMLGGNISTIGWPKCGEIDIMEYLGHETNKVYGTLHYDDAGHQYKGGSYSLSGTQGYDDQFHVFTIIWQENTITWYVDYNQYYELSPPTVKFDAFTLPQFFIFNVAVGGNWPGPPDATTLFPQTMTVDYVRVFQPL